MRVHPRTASLPHPKSARVRLQQPARPAVRDHGGAHFHRRSQERRPNWRCAPCGTNTADPTYERDGYRSENHHRLDRRTEGDQQQDEHAKQCCADGERQADNLQEV